MGLCTGPEATTLCCDRNVNIIIIVVVNTVISIINRRSCVRAFAGHTNRPPLLQFNENQQHKISQESETGNKM